GEHREEFSSLCAPWLRGAIVRQAIHNWQSKIGNRKSKIPLPSPVVPCRARFPALERAAQEQHGPAEKTQMFPRRVKMHFAPGSDQRMAVQNPNATLPLPGQPLEPLEKVDFFAGVQVTTESTHFAKCGRFTKDE